MVELPSENLGFVDMERPPVRVLHSMEEGSDFDDEVGWCAHSEMACIDGEAKIAIDGRGSHVDQFVPEDEVLVLHEV